MSAELRSALGRMGPNKAPAPDQIPNEFYSNLNDESLICILLFCNEVFGSGHLLPVPHFPVIQERTAGSDHKLQGSLLYELFCKAVCWIVAGKADFVRFAQRHE